MNPPISYAVQRVFISDDLKRLLFMGSEFDGMMDTYHIFAIESKLPFR